MPGIALALAGLAAVWIWPRREAAWWLLALAVSAGQWGLLPSAMPDFRETAEVMEWGDWMRVPAVAFQNFFRASWPGWALAFAGVGRMGVAMPWIMLGVLRAVLMVGWSEDVAGSEALVPKFWRTPELITGVFTMALALGGRRGRAAFLLCVPVMTALVLPLVWLWNVDYVMDLVVVAGYAGLILALRAMVR